MRKERFLKFGTFLSTLLRFIHVFIHVIHVIDMIVVAGSFFPHYTNVNALFTYLQFKF